MTVDRPQPTPAVETDPRFPSGRWTGFWIQRQMGGRNYMALELTFADGRLSGAGADCIGEFVLQGDYDLKDGRVTLIKRYIGAHDVEYVGRNEDDGQWIWGLWTIRNVDRGGFHLWPEAEADPTQRRLKREQDVPPPHSGRRIRLEPVGSPE